MAIEDIFRALEEQAQAECDDLLAVAQAQASSVMGEAKAEADRIKQAKLAAVEDITNVRASKTVNAARLESRKALAAVRDAAVARAFDGALAKLAQLRGRPEYAPVFKALAEEALAGVDGACELHVAPADAELGRMVLSGFAGECTLVTDADTIGGVIVTSDSGRIMRSNTFESRLAKSRSLVQARVAEILGS